MNVAHKAYSEIGLTTEVLQASPHRQIQLLLEKCLTHMQIITTAIQHQNYSQKHRSVSSAIDILNYLRLCLNFSDEKAQELSTLLNSLYEYAEKSLLQANLKNDSEQVDHARQVITQIKEGWDAIA